VMGLMGSMFVAPEDFVPVVTKAFEFRETFVAGKLIFGEFKNGAGAAYEFTKAGDELTVGVSMLNKISAETLNGIERGAIKTGEAMGVKSVTIEARMVTRQKFAELLEKLGFVKEIGKDGKPTGNWIKHIGLNGS